MLNHPARRAKQNGKTRARSTETEIQPELSTDFGLELYNLILEDKSKSRAFA
jgi:hypothetical protein